MPGALEQMELDDKKADELLKSNAGLSVGTVNTDKAHEDNDNTPSKDQSEVEEWKKKCELLEHKYNVLKGKEYAEVPRLQSENKALRDEVENLKKTVNELKDIKSKEANSKSSADLEKAYTSLKDELGEAAVGAIKQIVEGQAHPKTDLLPLQEKLNGYESKIKRLEVSQVKSSEDVFVEKLTALVSDWEKINSSVEWLRWLSNRVPGSDMTYQESLDAAHSKFNHKVVAEIFNTFKNSQKKTNASESGSSAEDWIEPGPAKPSNPDKSENKKTYTQREVDKYYEDYRRGRIAEKKWAEIEAELDRARYEGRIISS